MSKQTPKYILLGAGTGIAPFIHLRHHQNVHKIYYFTNKSSNHNVHDILKSSYVESSHDTNNFDDQANPKLSTMLSRPDMKFMADLIKDSGVENLEIVSCGPPMFNALVQQLLKNLRFGKLIIL